MAIFLNVLSAICLIIGASFVLISAIGFIRFNDVVRRQHCSSLVETGGAIFIGLGLILQSAISVNSVKVVILVVVMVYIGASSTHIFIKNYLASKNKDKNTV